MADTYDHKKIEKKWQEKWQKEGIYNIPDQIPGKENFYNLVEFSYPSGNLHVGHWYAFSVPDIYARFKRMQGYNVLYPMGFDAFGLPAENAAIKLGADPKVWTFEHMEKMRGQLRSMGAMFDWNREVVTCEPEYYKWTQWMFAKFFEQDLAYRANTKVNWCPKDQTILANEQVVNGKCERCGTEVIQKDQDQWMLRITKYADRLVDDLDSLPWPEYIKDAQRNWIGRTEGAEIDFAVVGRKEKIKVFTTRPETIFGATFVAVSAGLAKSWLDDKWKPEAEVKKYIDDVLKEQGVRDFKEKEKTGIVAGFNVVNPATKEEIPVWITNYVMDGVGTGAIMAVPAHDERDFDFAKKYNLPVKEVVVPSIIDSKNPHVDGWPVKERHNVHAVVYDPKRDAYLTLKWRDYDWQTMVLGGIEDGEDDIETAKREILEETGYKNVEFKKHLGSPVQTLYAAPHKSVNRIAWSTGIYFTLIDDEQVEVSRDEHEKFDVVWMPASEFIPQNITNIELSFWQERIRGQEKIWSESGVLINSGKFNGLSSQEAKQKIVEFVGGKMTTTYKLRDWGISRQRYWGVPIPIAYDPEGKAHAIPEKNLPWLLPTDVDYTPDGTAPLARSKELLERTEKIFGKGWKPEVETMDTFVDSSWYFYRYLDNKNYTEFASRERMKKWMPIDMYSGGAEHTTMHLLYSRFWTKALFDLGLVADSEPYKMRRNRGLILGPDGNKMSKSKGNVIDPDEVVKWVGADATRMYLAFMGPYGVTDNYPWDPNGVVGIRRFLERVLKLKSKIDDSRSDLHSSSSIHKTIKKVTEDILNLKFNTAISAMMVLSNEFEKQDSVSKSEFNNFLKILAPFAPHLTEEIWQELGEKESIHLSEWPKYDESKVKDDKVKIVIQINGKLRDEVEIDAGTNEEEIKKIVLARQKIVEKIAGAEIKKFIYVENKLANIVI